MLKAINNRLICKYVEPEKKSGLILSLNEEKKDTFTVVDASENEQGIREGDKIFVDPYNAQAKEVEGELFYFVNADNVLGVFDE